MDLATLMGLVAGVVIILLAMFSGPVDASAFFNLPGILIVFGGSTAATLIKFPLRDCIRSFGLATKSAFVDTTDTPKELIAEANRLAAIVRKNGVLGLDGEEIQNPFFRKGVALCVDGHDEAFIRDVMNHEMELSNERFEIGERIFRAIGDAAPAFGLVGTLVGLVQMLSNMKDAESLGPSMAVALLTTLYGALIANLVALPLADKLEIRAANERNNRRLIIDSIMSIKAGQNPRVMDELLETYLADSERGGPAEQPAG
ncbi:MAG: MotA/TolQ/ExbB proton channel family protein [Gammaproteobacteria bacterium]|jgi:chemotaxis protein MotA